jgi:hypothetical protein
MVGPKAPSFNLGMIWERTRVYSWALRVVAITKNRIYAYKNIAYRKDLVPQNNQITGG